MPDLSAEDAKLVTLARAARARIGAVEGAAVRDAERAKEPAIALSVAFAYWRERGIGAAADADDIERVTRLINGGGNGLIERTRYLGLAKAIWL